LPVSKSQTTLLGRLRARWRAVASRRATRKAALDREKAEQILFLMEHHNDTPGEALAFWNKLSRGYIRKMMGVCPVEAAREAEAERLLSSLRESGR
jgi:hypothetical protein